MSNGDELVYNFAGIDTISGQIAAFVSQMNADLNEVDSKFRNLLANGWSGAGAQAFEGCSSQWHSSANAMAETLQRLSTKVSDAGANMSAADASAAARF